MLKKISDFENRVNALQKDILDLDIDIKSNLDVFSWIKILQIKLSDLDQSRSCFSKGMQKQIVADLRFYSTGLKSTLYEILQQYIKQYILALDTLLNFMVQYPHLFLEDSDENKFHLLQIYDVFWHLLADFYAASSTPEVFAELCKNNTVLSREETLSLIAVIMDKFIFTVVKDILAEVSDRDIETKKILVQKIRLQYPNASHKVDHILLSKNKRNAIQQDFLILTKKSFYSMIEEELSQEPDIDFHQAISNISIKFRLISDEQWVNDMFAKYVSLFLESQFQESDQKNTDKKEKKRVSPQQNIFASALLASQGTSLVLKELPDGLKNEISVYLRTKKLNRNHEKISTLMIKTLQKILTKNESIRKQWFVEKMSSYGLHDIHEDLFVLLEKYGFSCTDINKSLSEDHCELEVIECWKTIATPKEPLSDAKNKILVDLDAFDALERLEWESKKKYLIKKMRWYGDVFEQLGYAFDNKEKFIESSAEYCYSNPRLDKDIKKIISDIIFKNKQEKYKDWRDYYVFNMPNGWRIILNKKGTISTIWSHDYYEKYLKNNL